MFQVQFDELYPMVGSDFPWRQPYPRKAANTGILPKIAVNPPQIRLETLFQTFHVCSKYNSMSSIQWYGQVFPSANHIPEKSQILLFSYENPSKTIPDSSRNIVPNFPCLFQVQLDELYPMVWSDFP